MVLLGIDPGVSGAIAAISPLGAHVADMPTVKVESTARTQRKIDPRGLAELLRQMVPADEACMVVLEDVHAMPGGKSGSSANTSLMHSKGVIEGVLGVLRFRVELVASQRWKRLYGLTSEKAASLDMARRLYPGTAGMLTRQLDHNRAEALLLAHYGKVKLS
jgi:crossover junction endodeoxyribonuclease RuvC